MNSPSYAALGLTVPVTEIIDPEKWKERYAWGFNLGGSETLLARVKRAAKEHGGDSGKIEKQFSRLIDDLPDSTIAWHLRSALSDLEGKLQVPMAVQVCKATPVDEGLVLGRDYDRQVPRLPYTRDAAQDFYRFNLPSSLISVERIRGYYFDVNVISVAAEDIEIQWPTQGVVHILPHTLTNWLANAQGELSMMLSMGGQRPIPSFWAVDYTTGPIAQNGEVGRVEAVLADWCYCSAGIRLLNIAGAAISKGLSGASVSLDGASQNVNFQASAMYGINSATEHMLEEALKRIDWKRLALQKRGMRVRAYGY